MKIAPSVLGCDFAHLADEIASVNTCDYLHLDVMDGLFVPNISFGIPVVESIHSVTEIPLDVHLMIDRPERYLPQFLKAGADILTFHLEATEKPEECIEVIRRAGAIPGISVKPGTPAESVFPFLDRAGLILVMTVEPGFGGQKLIPACLDKAKKIKDEILRRNVNVLLEADGGIGEGNLRAVAEAGVDISVVGSALFRAEDRKEVLRRLKGEA